MMGQKEEGENSISFPFPAVTKRKTSFSQTLHVIFLVIISSLSRFTKEVNVKRERESGDSAAHLPDENCFSLLVGVIHSTERESFDVRERNSEIASRRGGGKS